MQGQLERPPGRLNTAGLLDDLARLLPASSGQEGLQRVLARVSGAGRFWRRICHRLPPRPPAAAASLANSSVATPRLPLSQSHLKAQPAPSSVATYRQQCTSAQTAALLGRQAQARCCCRRLPTLPAVAVPPARAPVTHSCLKSACPTSHLTPQPARRGGRHTAAPGLRKQHRPAAGRALLPDGAGLHAGRRGAAVWQGAQVRQVSGGLV